MYQDIPNPSLNSRLQGSESVMQFIEAWRCSPDVWPPHRSAEVWVPALIQSSVTAAHWSIFAWSPQIPVSINVDCTARVNNAKHDLFTVCKCICMSNSFCMIHVAVFFVPYTSHRVILEGVVFNCCSEQGNFLFSPVFRKMWDVRKGSKRKKENVSLFLWSLQFWTGLESSMCLVWTQTPWSQWVAAGAECSSDFHLSGLSWAAHSLVEQDALQQIQTASCTGSSSPTS